MTDAASAPSQPSSGIPADDPNRKLTVADPDSSKVRHVAVVGVAAGGSTDITGRLMGQWLSERLASKL